MMPHTLLIDDNHNNNVVLKMLLQDAGFTITEVIDERTVHELLDQLTTVDLVLLDLEMPRLSGYQVKDQICNHPNFADVPIIACSVHINEMAITREQGFDGFIGKPIQSEQFITHVEQILQGKKVWISNV